MDATFSNCKATIGIVSRDHNRRILGAWTSHCLSPNAFCAEMEVVVQALIKAEEMNMEKADIESDSLGVILALQGLKDYEDWQAEDNTKKGRDILRRQTLWNLQHVNRQCNRHAHNLPQWAISSNFSGHVNLRSLSSFIFCEGEDDLVGPMVDDNLMINYPFTKKKRYFAKLNSWQRCKVPTTLT